MAVSFLFRDKDFCAGKTVGIQGGVVFLVIARLSSFAGGVGNSICVSSFSFTFFAGWFTLRDRLFFFRIARLTGEEQQSQIQQIPVFHVDFLPLRDSL